MRVLVTGSRGFIGSAVRRELESRGMECVPFDLPTKTILLEQDLWPAVAEAHAVVNLAGMLGTSELLQVDPASAPPSLPGGPGWLSRPCPAELAAADVNIIGAINVYDAAAHAGVPVVQIGTGHKGQPNPYAITKGAAEDIGLARAQWRGEKIAVVRAYHVYGPGQKACPPHGKSTVRKIIPSFACRALTGMDVEVNGSGAQVVDLVHVDDVARVLVDAVGGPYGEVVEAGTGKPTTVLDAAWAVIEAAGSRSQVTHVPMRPGEPEGAEVVAADPRCLNPWPHRLDETVAWYRDYLAAR
jgi:UDP-glucose 4-epimerase